MGTRCGRLMRAIFFDRDGVLNRAIVKNGKSYPPRTMAEFEILAEARWACQFLKAHGFLLLCVTNQPDIARGTANWETVSAFNELLRQTLGLDAVMVCPHDDADGCACRKPKPGLLLSGADAYGIDLTASFMIGDRWRDIEAGRAVGCRTAFVDRGYDEGVPPNSDYVASSTADAARWICSINL
jgi:D-glycero-D-manno-heptose 1,7-bisphosphate phosphatase